MKKTHKIISSLIAALMVIVLAMPIMTIAEVTPAEASAPSITITNTVSGKEYRVYKIFDVTTSDDGGFSYSIQSTSPWFTLIYGTNGTDGLASTYGLKLTQLDDTYYEVTVPTGNTFDAKGFAEKLKTYETQQIEEAAAATPATTPAIQGNNVGYASGTVAPGSTTVEIPVEDMGYYFVSTTIGSVCVLNTVTQNVSIVEKNAVPDIAKSVSKESGRIYDGDRTESASGELLDDILTFTIKVYPNITEAGATSTGSSATDAYVVHDTMSDGLSLYSASGETGKTDFTVYKYTKGINDEETRTLLTENTDYTVLYDQTHTNMDGHTGTTTCTFDVTFPIEFTKDLTANDRLEIEYTATLNEKAVESTITKDVQTAQTNKTHLHYGKYYTEEKTVSVNTYGFGLIKTNETGKFLGGAKFELYLDSDCKYQVPLVEIGSNDANCKCYRPATKSEIDTKPSVIVPIEVVKGYAKIYGLSSGTTYYLDEIQTPDGYNTLDAATPVTPINQFATVDYTASTYTNTITDNPPATDVIVIQNYKGQTLPSTGGMGTRLFYVFGGVLVIGAGILLITKRRMSNVK